MTDFYYCIPDIHGRYDLLKLALDDIKRAHPDGCDVIFLGDYIDRGPDNVKVLETVMNPMDNFNYTCIMGNHEDMFIENYDKQRDAWYDPFAYYQIRDEIGLEKAVTWMKALPIFHTVDRNVFAHAFYDDELSQETQRKNHCLWMRMHDSEPYINDKQGLYLTHGHTPRRYGPVTALNRVNLDAGAVFYDVLKIGKYKRGVQGLVDVLEFRI